MALEEGEYPPACGFRRHRAGHRDLRLNLLEDLSRSGSLHCRSLGLEDRRDHFWPTTRSYASDGQHVAFARSSSCRAERQCRGDGRFALFREYLWLGGGLLSGGVRADARTG